MSSSQINLAWIDNADNELGFVIERCTGSKCTDFAQIGTFGANVTSYSDTGLSEDDLPLPPVRHQRQWELGVFEHRQGYHQALTPVRAGGGQPGAFDDEDRALLEKVEAGFETVGELYNACKFRAAPSALLRAGLGEAMGLAREANGYTFAALSAGLDRKAP